METFSAMSGFAVALTLKNLLWGFVGVTLGTAIGVLSAVPLTIAPAASHGEPGSDRRADHVRGIYYGAMFGGSTTSSCSTRRENRRPSSRR
jgi:putative tricarboxylic transport membrane protein